MKILFLPAILVILCIISCSPGMLSGDFLGKYYRQYFASNNHPYKQPSKHYRHFRKAVGCIDTTVSGWGYFEHFRPGFGFWKFYFCQRF